MGVGQYISQLQIWELSFIQRLDSGIMVILCNTHCEDVFVTAENQETEH